MECRICGNIGKFETFEIKEMLFGLRDVFKYFECSECGCLQILEVPAEIEKYYTSKYFSQSQSSSKKSITESLVTKRDKFVLFNRGFAGRIVNIFYKNTFLEEIALRNVKSDSRILDVGCGKGELLYYFQEIGFTNLQGIDPFIDKGETSEHIKIHKNNIHNLPDQNKFDLIILNHSFEHMIDEIETLNKINNLLSEDGFCIIRIPLKSDYILEQYGPFWVQIDAPRHFYLHTIKSLELLLEKADFKIKKIIFDSTDFQFWGSEQFKRDIHLTASNSYFTNPEKSIFTKNEIRKYKKQAEELNKKQKGDQATFFIEKS